MSQIGSCPPMWHLSADAALALIRQRDALRRRPLIAEELLERSGYVDFESEQPETVRPGRLTEASQKVA